VDDSNVFSDEPTVELSREITSYASLREVDAPLFEILVDSDPDVEVQDGNALLGVVPPAPAPIIVEVVEDAIPTLDIVLEEQAVVDISALGLQGPIGSTGPLGPTGPVGPQGPPGLAGQGASVDFVFDVPSTEWFLPHGLGRRVVDVVTVDNNDEEIIGDVYFVDSFNSRVEWYYPTSGRATVST